LAGNRKNQGKSNLLKPNQTSFETLFSGEIKPAVLQAYPVPAKAWMVGLTPDCGDKTATKGYM